MTVAEPHFHETPNAAPERTVCAVHPSVETTLRCNKCGRYMCTRCAVRTPVGYRCRECVYQQQDAFFTATQADILIAGAISFGLGLPIGFLLPKILLVALILSIPAGSLIAEGVRRATGNRRGRNTWIVVAAGIIVSALIANFGLFQYLLAAMSYRGPGGGSALGGGLLALLSPVLYIVLCVGGAIARVRYGK